MYFSAQQIELSLSELKTLNPFFGMSFLAFKLAKMPVGSASNIVFSQFANFVLERHYRPVPKYKGFYNPFHTSKTGDRWVQPRHSETSLQRITTNTFGDAILHPKGESEWGWVTNYISVLRKHLGRNRIPAFDLAVWLYRNEKWSPITKAGDIEERLFDEYRISSREIKELFRREKTQYKPEFSPYRISEEELLGILGDPPGSAPDQGAALQRLEITEVGPSRLLQYEPSDRLNIITGDNSLGKTFILDCAWWALTGHWIGYPALPRRDAPKDKPSIAFGVTSGKSRVHDFSVKYDWERFRWKVPPKRRAYAGLVIYGRFDGSFGVWDPVRSSLLDTENDGRPRGHLQFSRDQIWTGLRKSKTDDTDEWACNGLLRDWITWQSQSDRDVRFDQFTTCLDALSPSRDEVLTPGSPIRMPLDALEIPTLTMDYGDVSVRHASAGVQRVLALAYILVWAWHEHLAMCESVRRQPQRRIVLIIDEVEAHLHPKWQRVIVPAMVEVIGKLATNVTTQLHIATHSPMVLASVEPDFVAAHDRLHHLSLRDKSVEVVELPFIKRGTVDSWLMSEVFNSTSPRSVPGEEAIKDAKSMQLAPEASTDQVRNMQQRLVKVLAPDDDFWPRWRHFALRHGVEQ